MAVIVKRSKISRGNQVVVPSSIRERFGLKQNDLVVWAVIDDEVHIKFIKREKGSLSKLIGKLDMGSTRPGDIDEVASSS